jgi:hypothetical protein
LREENRRREENRGNRGEGGEQGTGVRTGGGRRTGGTGVREEDRGEGGEHREQFNENSAIRNPSGWPNYITNLQLSPLYKIPVRNASFEWSLSREFCMYLLRSYVGHE